MNDDNDSTSEYESTAVDPAAVAVKEWVTSCTKGLAGIVMKRVKAFYEQMPPDEAVRTIAASMRIINVPGACPTCGEQDKFMYEIGTTEGSRISQTCRCNFCGSSWTEIYMLIGVGNPPDMS